MFPKSSKITSFVLCFLLLFEQSGFAQVSGFLDLSGYITGLKTTFTQDKYRPLHLRCLGYDANSNDFKLLLDKGDFVGAGLASAHNLQKEKNINQETNKLMEYFFIGLTLPNEAFWVNLRPDSPDNTIDSELAKTDIGKILLEADVQLKKDTALSTSPRTSEGKKYWDKLYKKAEELYGCDNITIPTLTRPWIVPGEIIIRETKTIPSAYIYKATLKIMLEEDYLRREQKTEYREQKNIVGTPRRYVEAVRYEFKDPRAKELNRYSTELIRELIIPKLTKDINTSKRYAPLRQVYYSLILAQWFKQRFNCRGGSPYPPVNKRLLEDIKTNNHNGTAQRPSPTDIINSCNLTGLTSKAPWSKETYYQEYQKSFTDGEYSLKEPARTSYGQTIRSYFSGGIKLEAGLEGTLGSPVCGIAAKYPFSAAKHSYLIPASASSSVRLDEGIKIIIPGQEQQVNNLNREGVIIPADQRAVKMMESGALPEQIQAYLGKTNKTIGPTPDGQIIHVDNPNKIDTNSIILDSMRRQIRSMNNNDIRINELLSAAGQIIGVLSEYIRVEYDQEIVSNIINKLGQFLRQNNIDINSLNLLEEIVLYLRTKEPVPLSKELMANIEQSRAWQEFLDKGKNINPQEIDGVVQTSVLSAERAERLREVISRIIGITAVCSHNLENLGNNGKDEIKISSTDKALYNWTKQWPGHLYMSEAVIADGINILNNQQLLTEFKVWVGDYLRFLYGLKQDNTDTDRQHKIAPYIPDEGIEKILEILDIRQREPQIEANRYREFQKAIVLLEYLLYPEHYRRINGLNKEILLTALYRGYKLLADTEETEFGTRHGIEVLIKEILKDANARQREIILSIVEKYGYEKLSNEELKIISENIISYSEEISTRGREILKIAYEKRVIPSKEETKKRIEELRQRLMKLSVIKSNEQLQELIDQARSLDLGDRLLPKGYPESYGVGMEFEAEPKSGAGYEEIEQASNLARGWIIKKEGAGVEYNTPLYLNTGEEAEKMGADLDMLSKSQCFKEKMAGMRTMHLNFNIDGLSDESLLGIIKLAKCLEAVLFRISRNKEELNESDFHYVSLLPIEVLFAATLKEASALGRQAINIRNNKLEIRFLLPPLIEGENEINYVVLKAYINVFFALKKYSQDNSDKINILYLPIAKILGSGNNVMDEQVVFKVIDEIFAKDITSKIMFLKLYYHPVWGKWQKYIPGIESQRTVNRLYKEKGYSSVYEMHNISAGYCLTPLTYLKEWLGERTDIKQLPDDIYDLIWIISQLGSNKDKADLNIMLEEKGIEWLLDLRRISDEQELSEWLSNHQYVLVSLGVNHQTTDIGIITQERAIWRNLPGLLNKMIKEDRLSAGDLENWFRRLKDKREILSILNMGLGKKVEEGLINLLISERNNNDIVSVLVVSLDKISDRQLRFKILEAVKNRQEINEDVIEGLKFQLYGLADEELRKRCLEILIEKRAVNVDELKELIGGVTLDTVTDRAIEALMRGEIDNRSIGDGLRLAIQRHRRYRIRQEAMNKLVEERPADLEQICVDLISKQGVLDKQLGIRELTEIAPERTARICNYTITGVDEGTSDYLRLYILDRLKEKDAELFRKTAGEILDNPRTNEELKQAVEFQLSSLNVKKTEIVQSFPLYVTEFDPIIRISKDNRFIAVLGNERTVLMSLDTGEIIYKWEKLVWITFFESNGETLALLNYEKYVSYINLNNLKLGIDVKKQEVILLKEKSGYYYDIIIDPRGKFIIGYYGWDNEEFLFRISLSDLKPDGPMQKIMRFKDGVRVENLVVDAQGKFIVYRVYNNAECSLSMINLDNVNYSGFFAREIMSLKGGGSVIFKPVIDSKGKFIVCGYFEKYGENILSVFNLRDIESGGSAYEIEPSKEGGEYKYSKDYAIDPRGEFIVYSYSVQEIIYLRVINTSDFKRPIMTMKMGSGFYPDIQFTSDGKYIIIEDGNRDKILILGRDFKLCQILPYKVMLNNINVVEFDGYIILNCNEGLVVSSGVNSVKTVNPLQASDNPRNESVSRFGGIDFTRLPMVMDAVNNLSSNVTAADRKELAGLNLSQAWQSIEAMRKADIIPCAQRIKEYLQACCLQGGRDIEIDKVSSCISDIFRLEEETSIPSDPLLKNLAAVLDSFNPRELREILLGQ